MNRPSPGFADATGFPDGFARPDPLLSPASPPPPPPGCAPRLLREALATQGADALSDEDLATLLLGFVLPVDSRPLAQAVLRRFGSFAALLAAPQRELRAVPGLGTHGISAIKLVHAAALRLARAQVMHRPVLDRWDALIAYLTAALARERVEQFRVLFLDGEHRLLADEAQARGTVNHTPVYPREVVKRALELRAAALILVHNHPSGDPTPSREDLAMTEQVREAAESLSIDLHDHVIVGNGRHLSFRQEGLI
ncbi:DNA repair protein RadC [Roseomonas sp. OT10]|uniref:RadC family protein n=1 Tax=Roseomonas cutis TaxID=2897332 RepID=UPI001E37183A|nr:DNA repair protein RadC [Roseomonas sp. OT10]UFN49580.1 DNA repair protein RadC [Roseomonas sp. OT10]